MSRLPLASKKSYLLRGGSAIAVESDKSAIGKLKKPRKRGNIENRNRENSLGIKRETAPNHPRIPTDRVQKSDRLFGRTDRPLRRQDIAPTTF